MKPKDIKVGALYKNTSLGLSDNLYLGVGKRVMWEGTNTNKESNFTDKHLVIVNSNDDTIGQMIQDPENCFRGVWESFIEVK